MTPQEYKKRYEQSGVQHSPLSHNNLVAFNFLPQTVDFLTLVGLPSEAAPFLCFVQGENHIDQGMGQLPLICDDLERDYGTLVMIGSDGSGNPIAINTTCNDRIDWIDHEDGTVKFMNTSIDTLANFLLLYEEFIRIVRAENGKDAFLNSDFTNEQYEALRKEMETADPRAVVEGFWCEELGILLANREWEKKQH